jgi:integrase/recombinase XerD
LEKEADMGSPSKVVVSGPLQAYAAGFALALARIGYTQHSTAHQLRVFAHLSRWLAAEGLDVGELTPAVCDAFLSARRAAGYRMWLSPKALQPLLGYLRQLHVAPPEPVIAPSPAQAVLARFGRYLASERGLARSTVNEYVYMVRPFLSTREGPKGTLELTNLAAADITGFVVAKAPRRSVGSAKLMVTALRSLLDFLHVQGLLANSLASVVPTVAGSRLALLPKGLAPGQVQQLLTSCDRKTAIGRRDFAVLTLLVRLGLRAGEVVALELGDLDWRAGEIVVRGKGDRHERLPLPVDIGTALVDYLQAGRPSSECRQVFLRMRAPHRALSPSGLCQIVLWSAHKAGLPPVGAHRLRHTAATQMLRSGASLTEIGQVLRHRSLLSTAIYAKVDHQALRQVARRWPTRAKA